MLSLFDTRLTVPPRDAIGARGSSDAGPALDDTLECPHGACSEVATPSDALEQSDAAADTGTVADEGLRIEAPLLRVGEFGRFRLVRGSGEPAPAAVQWSSADSERLVIAAIGGLGRAVGPGAVLVTARHEEGVTESTVEIATFNTLSAELLSVSPMKLGVAAAQGLLHHDGVAFTAFNSVDDGPCIAALDDQLHVTRQACSVPPGWPGAHVGSLTRVDHGLMLPYMHVLAQPISGLRVVDYDTFETINWYDTSDRYPYLDAIDVADGHLWLDAFQLFVRVPLIGPESDTPDFDAAVVFRRSVSGALQGLRVRHGRLWAMAETTSTHASLIGLHAYDLDSLEPESGADFAATLNSPSHVWRFSFPADQPYHEGFDFEPGSTDRISFPIIPTNQVHRLALEGE